MIRNLQAHTQLCAMDIFDSLLHIKYVISKYAIDA